MVQHRDMRIDVTALLVGSREATQSAQSVDDDAERDDADEQKVQPDLFMAEDRGTAGNLDQVPEEILADLDRAGECHVAEQEDAEDGTGDGLSHVNVCRPLAGTLSILEGHAGDDFGAGGGMTVLDVVGSHDRFP